MPAYTTPGVYIEEIPQLPPSIVSVATSVPVFIGYTVKHADVDGTTLLNKPKKIFSLTEFEQHFGSSDPQVLEIKLTRKISASSGEFTDSTLSLNDSKPILPMYFLYYSIRLYFANGGGPCYIFSVGSYAQTLNPSVFTNAFPLLESLVEISLIVFPDVCKFPKEQFGDLVDTALAHCKSMQNRFLVVDVPDGTEGGNDNINQLRSNFREKISSDAGYLKYSAAYFPYLKTTIPVFTNDDAVKIVEHTEIRVNQDGSEEASQGIYQGLLLNDEVIKSQNPDDYGLFLTFAEQQCVTLPPSGAVSGAYVRNDKDKGVWKAPANISLSNVSKPEISVTEGFQEELNTDPQAGKSINAIRTFAGKGNLIWGARTLAGNDNEWRYVPVMRLFIMLKESIQTGTQFAVFEPNDMNLWIRIKSMTENYLSIQWRDGALTGAKPEQAFFVKVGLGETMTEDDILNNRLIIAVGIAPVKPAEFIIFRITHNVTEQIPENVPAPKNAPAHANSFLERLKQFFRPLFSWLGFK